jgi:Ca-activated chloride channel family protein
LERKKNIPKRFYLSVLFFILAGSHCFGQPQRGETRQLTRILFLFDASQSMIGTWQSDTKFEIAKKLLGELVDSLQRIDNLELAMRVYGHTKNFPPQDCDDTRLEVPFARLNGFQIKKKLSEISARGTTPIARCLIECEKDFPESPARNIIILITDGIEECGGDPCAASLALQKKGIALKPFVIGLGMNKDFLKSFECIGNYFDASNEASFKTILNVVISQALNNTTAQVNLLDVYNKPTETNVNMTFYDRFSGLQRYDYVHTMNSKGLPDTLKLDPLTIYRLVVHTIPPVTKDSIMLVPGKHTIIGVDAPQGDLLLKFDGAQENKKLNCIIRKSGETKTLHVQDFNSSERYIVGKYDLEVLCLPRMYINDVDISQSKTTTVQIPKPGIATLLVNNPGYGSLYQVEKNELKWVYNMGLDATKETIILMPGRYKFYFRPKGSRESIYTIEKEFTITSGSSISVQAN